MKRLGLGKANLGNMDWYYIMPAFAREPKDGIFVTSILGMYGVGALFRDFGAHTPLHNCHRCICENEELVEEKIRCKLRMKTKLVEDQCADGSNVQHGTRGMNSELHIARG